MRINFIVISIVFLTSVASYSYAYDPLALRNAILGKTNLEPDPICNSLHAVKQEKLFSASEAAEIQSVMRNPMLSLDKPLKFGNSILSSLTNIDALEDNKVIKLMSGVYDHSMPS